MSKITDGIKQQIPKLVGNEVKKLIRKNIDNYDNEALDFAGKTIETEIEKTLGLPSSIVSLENKSGFNYKISGTEKTIIRYPVSGTSLPRVTNYVKSAPIRPVIQIHSGHLFHSDSRPIIFKNISHSFLITIVYNSVLC